MTIERKIVKKINHRLHRQHAEADHGNGVVELEVENQAHGCGQPFRPQGPRLPEVAAGGAKQTR